MFWIDPLLTPLARLAIRKGWLFKQVEKRLKHAYIAAAQEMDDGAVTDSKISVLTGLQRRDIAALRNEAAAAPPPRNPLAEIISVWWNDPAYSPEGIPTQGEGNSFATLARSIRQDVHPRTFLNLLIESGAVTEIEDTVSLVSRSHTPALGSDDQLAYLTENVGDHLSAAVENVVGAQSNYDMAVHYKGLSTQAIDTLKAHYRTRMSQLIEELDTMARELPQTDDGPYRFRAGGYFFDDTHSKAEPDDP